MAGRESDASFAKRDYRVTGIPATAGLGGTLEVDRGQGQRQTQLRGALSQQLGIADRDQLGGMALLCQRNAEVGTDTGRLAWCQRDAGTGGGHSASSSRSST